MSDVAREKTFWDEYEIFMWLGIAGYIFAGMLGLMGGITFFASGSSVLGGMCWIVVLVLIVGGSVLLAIGLKGKRKHKELERVADLLRAYRRIEITKLAQKMGVTPLVAEYTIADCLGKGLVEGYIDRREGEFFTKEALYQVMELDRGPICGAPPDDLYLVGEEIRCKYCGSVDTAQPKKVTGDGES